jgi:1-acyl-sn-glycerol-3-phosphate acyltransferase
MLLEMIFRWKGILYILGHGGVRLGLALCGITVRLVGAENIPIGRAAVYCANHQSNVDPPILFTTLHPRMHIVYKAEINAIPLLGRTFRHGGFLPIERRNKEAAMRSLEAGARSIQAGNSFLIFPEGTRSKTAEMLPFKKGGFLMALRAQAPIVPVAVSGGRDAMQKGSKVIRPVTVSIRVGKPIETEGMQMTDRDALIATVRERINALLAEGPVLD